jgi:hypothetical protein
MGDILGIVIAQDNHPGAMRKARQLHFMDASGAMHAHS